jgi:hypothetical protein
LVLQGIWLFSYSPILENPNFQGKKSFTALPKGALWLYLHQPPRADAPFSRLVKWRFLGIAIVVFPYRERFFFANGVKECSNGMAGLVALFLIERCFFSGTSR